MLSDLWLAALAALTSPDLSVNAVTVRRARSGTAPAVYALSA